MQFIEDPRFFSPHDQIAAVIKLKHLPSEPVRHQSDETSICISLQIETGLAMTRGRDQQPLEADGDPPPSSPIGGLPAGAAGAVGERGEGEFHLLGCYDNLCRRWIQAGPWRGGNG